MTGKDFLQNVQKAVGTVIVGKEESITLLLTALLADGHVLLEDLPGSGKTKLAKSLAKIMEADFSRIQFTPDLLPSDLTGLNIFDRNTSSFVLKKGPVFTNILLADEINRATPRTQAGLLEAMEEHQVTIDGQDYPFPDLFFVVATQNPVEQAGTFPLPEAQLDRFLMKLSVGLPTAEEELRILQEYKEADPFEKLESVIKLSDILVMKREMRKVTISEDVQKYMVEIVRATRQSNEILYGASPRALLGLQNASMAYAYLQGRNYVIPDDVKFLAVPVLAHRIVRAGSYGKNKDAGQIIRSILSEVKVPVEDLE